MTGRLLRRSTQRGLSLVELMVGITIGLFIVAGASLLATNQLSDNRRLTLETQIQQDLRAAADIIVRDLRRSGYWASAQLGVARDGSVPIENPYAATVPASAASAVAEIGYQYSLDGENDNNAIDGNEQMGVRLDDGVLQLRLGNGGWQPLTDSGTVRITQFAITVNSRPIALPCMKACAPGAVDCPRQIEVRDVGVLIVGQAVHDPAVIRSVRGDLRMRNDRVSGSCPA